MPLSEKLHVLVHRAAQAREVQPRAESAGDDRKASERDPGVATHAVILTGDAALLLLWIVGWTRTAARWGLLHIAVYNFCRIHGTIRCTPAMAAGVVDRLWSMDDLYNAVTEHAAKERAKAKRERWIQRLIDKLQEGK